MAEARSEVVALPPLEGPLEKSAIFGVGGIGLVSGSVGGGGWLVRVSE